MNKVFYSIVILFFVVLLSACGVKKETLMDRPLADGKYHYSNKDFEFSIVLPEEFIYYQTQRKASKNFVDLEFFVPSSDTEYRQDIPGYVKPFYLRIYEKKYWDKTVEEDEINNSDYLLRILGEKNNKVYLFKYWKETSSDWKNKWNGQMREDIIASFVLQEYK